MGQPGASKGGSRSPGPGGQCCSGMGGTRESHGLHSCDPTLHHGAAGTTEKDDPPAAPTWVGLPNHFQSCRAGRKAAILGRFSTDGRRCLLASSLVVGRWTPSLFLGRLLAPAWALGGRGGVGCGGGAWAAGAGAFLPGEWAEERALPACLGALLGRAGGAEGPAVGAGAASSSELQEESSVVEEEEDEEEDEDEEEEDEDEEEEDEDEDEDEEDEEEEEDEDEEDDEDEDDEEEEEDEALELEALQVRPPPPWPSSSPSVSELLLLLSLLLPPLLLPLSDSSAPSCSAWPLSGLLGVPESSNASPTAGSWARSPSAALGRAALGSGLPAAGA